MDPLHFVARTGPDGAIVVEATDADALFAEGGRALEEGRPADAIAVYQALLDGFPTSDLRGAAMYNLALSLERAGRYADAVAAYRAILVAEAHSADAVDAMFRIAGCHEAEGDWARAAEALAAVLARPDLGDRDRIQATVLLGDALAGLGRYEEADAAYREVLRRRRGDGAPRAQIVDERVFARAQYGVAHTAHLRFSDMPIRLPDDVMERDIHDKAATFLRSQAAYFRAMGYKDARTSTDALMSVGRMYEEFYDDLMAAPIPPELTLAEEVEVYKEELRKKIRPLVERAAMVYERQLRFAQGLGAEGEALSQTVARLARVRELLALDGARTEAPPAPAGEAVP